ncbi:MAG: DUF547 domain-containing protein [Deltaproteobacteria bacterium]|nr:MAG: DUF547 domain-containing protein [Deltaproteobacteria bacterium]
MRAIVLSLALVLAPACTRVVEPRGTPAVAPAGEPFSHEVFAEVLAASVDERGLIDYAGLQADRAKLDTYTATLAAESPASHPERFPTKDAELAYWINAYNALAITAVIDRPGLDRVIDNRIDFFWRSRYPLGDLKVSLYHLENEIVRKHFDDPRIHFALNCQSAGCPKMRQEPFPAMGLDAVLDAETRAFLQDPRNVRVEGDTLHLSQIFQWYPKDFAAEGGAEAFVRARLDDLPKTSELAYIPYDWALISQPGRKP